MSPRQTFVLVGASLAGARAAETLRAEGFDGRVVLVGAEPEIPYERPALSKEYLRGEVDRETFAVHHEDFYADVDVELLTSTTVTAVDPRERQVTLSSARRLTFDRLLLATGAEPRRLELPGADLDGIHYLRTVADADRLRPALIAGARVVVVGAGWIGCEVAASAHQLGCAVTLVEPAAVPLQRVLGDEIGVFFRDAHTAHGVTFLGRTGIIGFEGTHRVASVVTTDGRRLACDVVVVGVGVFPRTRLAEQAGIGVDNGVLVDARLESNVPGIFAAGDVANVAHPRLDQRARVEHWASARHQGVTAARSMLGRRASYQRLPYFFSDQYDIGLEYVGYAPRWDDVVVRGDPFGGRFLAFWLSNGRVRAGMHVNTWDARPSIERLIDSSARVNRDRLADPDAPLNQLAPPAA